MKYIFRFIGFLLLCAIWVLVWVVSTLWYLRPIQAVYHANDVTTVYYDEWKEKKYHSLFHFLIDKR